MCNLYNISKGPRAILEFTRAMINEAGNLEPGDVYPDYSGPIVRNGDGGRVLARARWGLPSSRKALMDAASRRADKLRAKGKDVDFDHLLKMEPDSGTTNVREGLIATDLYGFLTTEPNAVVAPVHRKAMPVILTTAEEIDTWMTAPWEEAKALQRSLPGSLMIVDRPGKSEAA